MAKDELSFEQSLAELEEIVSQLEDGQLGLSESLAKYEAGIKHLKRCYDALQKTERKIELLAGVDAEGNAITEPFDDEATTLEEKQQTRSRRRSRPAARSPDTASGKDQDDVDEQGGLF